MGTQYKRYKVKSKKKKKVLIAFIVLFAVIGFAFLVIKRHIEPIILRVTQQEVYALTNKCITESVLEVMSSNLNNYNLLKIEYDDEKNVKFLEVDALTISILAKQVTVLVQEKIKLEGERGISVPIGSLSGFSFFAGKGPDLNIKVVPASATNASLTSSFVSSGINQTLHRVNMIIDTGIVVTVPGIDETIHTTNQVLLSESIIIGKIPDTYLYTTNLKDMLDLIGN